MTDTDVQREGDETDVRVKVDNKIVTKQEATTTMLLGEGQMETIR